MSWSDRFLTLFAEIAGPLADVLNADGCREGWLQGELYRHFRRHSNGFRVNFSYRSGRVKHDLYCSPPNEMVAELKVFGLRGYLNKNLCGQSNIDRFLPAVAGTRVMLRRDEIDRLQPASGSYLADVRRLWQLPDLLERYMILVLQKAHDPDDFGRAISAIQVSSEEREWQCQDFLVRVSRIQ
jgi:hypothetical protein